MALALYIAQLVLTLIVGVVAYRFIKPTVSQGRRAIIAGIIALIFTLGMSAVIESLGLNPHFENVVNDTE